MNLIGFNCFDFISAYSPRTSRRGTPKSPVFCARNARISLPCIGAPKPFSSPVPVLHFFIFYLHKRCRIRANLVFTCYFFEHASVSTGPLSLRVCGRFFTRSANTANAKNAPARKISFSERAFFWPDKLMKTMDLAGPSAQFGI